MRELIIDPEFQSVIPPLSPDEREGLKESIRQYGFLPEQGMILTWNDIIIDGHNRYEICLELEKETGQVFLDTDAHSKEVRFLKTRADVFEWILRNQLGRRNLTDAAKINVALKIKDILREKARENQKTSTGGATPQLLANLPKAEKKPINTRKEIASIVGRSERTVGKMMRIKDNAEPELFDEVISGKKSIHAGYLEVKSKRKGDEEKPNESKSPSKPSQPSKPSLPDLSIQSGLTQKNVPDVLTGHIKSFNENILIITDFIKNAPLTKTQKEKTNQLIHSARKSLDKLSEIIDNN